MEFDRLLQIVQDQPVFETGLLLAGEVDPDHVRRQLTRWANAGKVFKLRRGLYALAPPYQKVRPHPFVVANRMVPGSYVSLQSALAHYTLIPETVPATTSVALDRPRRWTTPLGIYVFRYVQKARLSGYHLLDLGSGPRAVVARPEKALLDLAYLTRHGDDEEYLQSLRLQNFELLDPEVLDQEAQRFRKPKVRRAADQILQMIREQGGRYEAR